LSNFWPRFEFLLREGSLTINSARAGEVITVAMKIPKAGLLSWPSVNCHLHPAWVWG